MTDAEIIKALECCSTDRDCSQCPSQNNYPFCGEILSGFALDLINRQQAEIERLETVLDIWQVGYASMEKGVRKLEEQLATAKSEAYKEFAERLCANRVSNDPVVIAVKAELKEMG